MDFFRKKATFFEGCGKTAPQPVGPTEKRPETDRFGSRDRVTPTAPINGGGLVDTDRLPNRRSQREEENHDPSGDKSDRGDL